MTLREMRRQYPDLYRWANDSFDADFGRHPLGVWYRSPSWGDYVIWNRKYGFQLYTDVGRGVIKITRYINLK